MIKQKWITLADESCPYCGNNLEAYTVSATCCDSDEVRCCECSFRGFVSVDENGNTLIQQVYESQRLCRYCNHRSDGECYMIQTMVSVHCDCEGPYDGYSVKDCFGCVLFEPRL